MRFSWVAFGLNLTSEILPRLARKESMANVVAVEQELRYEVSLRKKQLRVEANSLNDFYVRDYRHRPNLRG